MEASGSPFECPICFEHYDDASRLPCTLPCGHSCCISHISGLHKCFHCRAPISDELSIQPSFALRDAALLVKQLPRGNCVEPGKSDVSFLTKIGHRANQLLSGIGQVKESSERASNLPPNDSIDLSNIDIMLSAESEPSLVTSRGASQRRDRRHLDVGIADPAPPLVITATRLTAAPSPVVQSMPRDGPRPTTSTSAIRLPERLPTTVSGGSKRTDCGHFCSSTDHRCRHRCCMCTPRAVWYQRPFASQGTCQLCAVRRQTAVAFQRAVDAANGRDEPLIRELHRRVTENERVARAARAARVRRERTTSSSSSKRAFEHRTDPDDIESCTVC